jgi:fructuronate reductase
MAPLSLANLSLDTLHTLPEQCRPLVRPDELRAGIVHFGLGNFHRAHQAVYTELALAAAGGDWGIIGVAPRSHDVLDRLTIQDRLYSVVTITGAESSPRVVGSLAALRHAAADPLATVGLLADPQIKVVTLTITEKGYGLVPTTGRVRDDPDLIADLTTDRPPRTLPGLLVRGLLARAAADAAPLAVVSCDNLPSNGRLLAGLAYQAFELAGAGDATFDWLAANVRFPGTTVDRIVPATTEEILLAAQHALGVRDLAAVAAEPFRQWVIEDDFPGGRPSWEAAGAILTSDAHPWEQLKLRVLNGPHSALAYLGALAGVDTIAASLDLPHMRVFLQRVVSEDVAPTLSPPNGVSVSGYGATVLERFANPALGHSTRQVAMDGSQKLPQRLFGVVADRRAAGAEPRYATLTLAAWLRYVRGVADDGTRLPLDDPLADTLRAAVEAAPDTPAGLTDAVLSLPGVVPPAVGSDDVVRRLVRDWLGVLDRHGVAGALAQAGS